MSKKGEPVPAIVLRDGELARREGGRVAVRETPLRFRVELADLVTSDGHRLNVSFGCSVVARPEAAERQMLEEALLSDRAAATAGDAGRLFTPGLREAAGRAVSVRAVEEWIDVGRRAELVDVLREAARAGAFAAGLEMLPPYQVDVESPSLQRMERDRSAREMAERAEAERLAHVRRAAEVLKEFDAIRAASPGLPVSALISRVAAEDQPRVVQGLMEAAGRRAESLYVVAGPCLIKVSAAGALLDEINVPAKVGPFRSVQEIRVDGESRVALGGRSGVVVLAGGAPSEAVSYVAPELTSAMGINRVVVWGGRLWASHSEAGLMGWDLGERGRPSVRIGRERLGTTGGDGPRFLQVAGRRLVFAVGPQVWSVDESLEGRPADNGGMAEPVVALLPHDRGVIVVRSSGEVEVLDVSTLSVVRRDRRASRVTAAALLPFYESPRLVLANEDGPLMCVSVDDPAVLQYPSPHRGLRALAASPGRVAGVSADRQRIVLFDVGQGRRIEEVHVAARVKHRVADATFVA